LSKTIKHLLRMPITRFSLIVFIVGALFILFSCGPKPAPDRISDDFEQAQRYADEGNCHKAIDKLRDILKIDDKNALAYKKIAECYVEMEEPESAITNYEGAIVFNPRDRDAYERVGEIYFNRGMYHEAMTWYDRALQIGYISPESYVKLARIHQNWHEYSIARNYYETAVRIDSTNAGGHYGLGVIDLVSGDTTDAESEFEKSVEFGSEARAAFRLGQIYAERKQYDEAIKWLDKCISIEGKSDLAERAYQFKSEIIMRMKSGQK
jgi:tetratricopeptide (TPR) repeat protein